ncbi:XRE family transcriptional regulator [Xanthomonas sp. BRIP62409]|uniref:XRE family transcriptional regulator n=1 Tax=Xanthomonas sp. BRIP62409 TaxID=2182388 RepID=UPI000F8E19EF|nr:XRE family transcriptional regulator [Xanthomonas sp. BRIP62409]
MPKASLQINLTLRHVRSARALLAWSQKDLAKCSGVTTSIVEDFERGQCTLALEDVQAIRGALEGAGIRFLPTGAVTGPDVPAIAFLHHSGTPVRWVNADDLSEWANRIDAAHSLPELLAHLIRGSHSSKIRLRFPSDSGVRHSGWDGQTSTTEASDYVPRGNTGWEIGSQRSNITRKASEDFLKRTGDPAPLDPAKATYVFVTPRHWPRKDQWAKAKQAKGIWKEVRAYDANDLVHWIEQTPAAGLWLATRLGKRPIGTRRVEDVWDEWSLATQWPLTEELVLSDRDEDAVEVLQWLRNEPTVLSLQATTTDEVIAFFHATLGMLPEYVASVYRARSLVATTAAGARALLNAPGPLILLLSEAEPGLARSLVEHGHYVLQAYDDRPVSRGEIRQLERLSREGIACALLNTGIAEARAHGLARDSARNLAILRRLIPSAPGRAPSWAQEPASRALLAGLLAGGWDEDSEADKARVSELAGLPYEHVTAALAHCVGDLDKPLRKIGSTWRMASPPDAWFLLAPNLTSADISHFEAAAHSVLGSTDPRFDMDPGERWMAAIKGVHPDYSVLMRHGIGEVLILLALWGDRAHTVPDATNRVDAIVRKLLLNADRQRWWSLSGEFRLLAEAAPKAFLDGIEDSLDQADPPIRALFGSDGDDLFDSEHLSDLLWALESLAWSPDLMQRVTYVLARLDVIDNPPGRHSNRPANSLRAIHLLWNPQTFAALDPRLGALDFIRRREPDAAWKLMLRILPSGHDSLSPSPLPRWRDYSVDQVEVVTYGLIRRGAAAISERLLAEAGSSGKRWTELLEHLTHLAPNVQTGLSALERAEPSITDATDRQKLWKALRHLLHHHRSFPDAQWSMPVSLLDQLEKIYDRFAPIDSLESVAWLFGSGVELPNPSQRGWQAAQREVDATRVDVAQSLYAERGAASVLALAQTVEASGLLGKALYEGGLRGSDLDALVETAVRSDHLRERALAHGLIAEAFRDLKEAWGEALLARAKAHAWGDVALLTILRAFPSERWTWDRVAETGEAIEGNYWRNLPVFWIEESADQIQFVIRKFMSVGRPRHVLPLAQSGGKSAQSSELLIELLQEAAKQPITSDEGGNEATMFQHYVAEIFRILDERSEVDEGVLAPLEWTYLSVLNHSHRPAKALLKVLSEQPALFVQMLKAISKPAGGSRVYEPEPDDPEHAGTMARQARKLLDLWNRVPGTDEHNKIDRVALEQWVTEAKSLSELVGRGEIADKRIGMMLSASPMGADGHWPAEAVRDALDLFRSRPMIDSFWIGKRNRRGMTSRSPRDGGELERKEAAKYANWAKAISLDHPYTARALNMLADSYEEEAKRHDESAGRLDWE